MKIAVNGFGRIGRLVLRAAFAKDGGDSDAIEWVAVNDITDAHT
ncbi:MAG: type I glyceraldehyde-3-phosphate dehydrogenase, partial [Elusimicrobia bacterium]|nr:type I glyceraldehyde-3-phosphate dehydrogenase [Elusimicrobiota bacterium]